MPSKKLPKPRAGLDALKVNRDTKEAIENAIACFANHGIDLSEKDINNLRGRIRKFFLTECGIEGNVPSVGAIKNRLTRLNEAAKDFADAISDLDYWSMAAILQGGDVSKFRNPDSPLPPQMRDKVNCKVGLHEADFWQSITAVTLKDMEDVNGKRVRNQYLYSLIYIIADCYHSQGLKPGLSKHPDTAKPGGPFFRLTKDIFKCFDVYNSTDSALYSLIRNGINYWKEQTNSSEKQQTRT